VRKLTVLVLALAWASVGKASLEEDGTWNAGVWATTVWADGVWVEGEGEAGEPCTNCDRNKGVSPFGLSPFL
jgi:hypothetical protein